MSFDLSKLFGVDPAEITSSIDEARSRVDAIEATLGRIETILQNIYDAMMTEPEPNEDVEF